MKLSLLTKFNLVFVFIFMVGFLVIGIIGDELREDSVRFWLESALRTRNHTNSSLLNAEGKREFRPPSGASYAAAENLNVPFKEFDNAITTESALNPNDPGDRASDQEDGQEKKSRSDARLNEVASVCETAAGRSLDIACPQIENQFRPTWNITAFMVPHTMTDIDDGNNGFGRKLDEIVSQQIISVPIEVPVKRVDKLFKTAMLLVLIVFAFAVVALNVMVYYLITRRIGKLSRLADEVSMGKFDGDDFDVRGRDEVSGLAQSFYRMRTSLARALKMLEETN